MAAHALPRQNHNTPSPIVPFLAFCAVIVAALGALFVVGEIAVSKHATEPRTSEQDPTEAKYTRQDVYNVLMSYELAQNRKLCKEVILFACPNAKDMYGYPSPQFKAACRINGTTRYDGLWLVAIIGTRYSDPVYVTGFAMHWPRLESTARRDGCAQADVSLLGGLLR